MRARLSEPESIVRVRNALRFGPVAVVFCAQATRFDIYLVPIGGVADAEDEFHLDRSFMLVAITNFGLAHHFRPGSLSTGYVMEKLGLKYEGDANNIAAFLNALGASDGVEGYLGRIQFAMSRDGKRLDHVESPEPRRKAGNG